MSKNSLLRAVIESLEGRQLLSVAVQPLSATLVTGSVQAAPAAATAAPSTWTNASFASQSGTFTVQFDARPTAANEDAANEDTVIGLSNGAASAHTQLAAIVRFNDTGQIDARNGGTYAQQSSIRYVPGATYHFKLVVNVPQHTYSIYVTPPGGSQVTLGQNFAFRTEQRSVTRLNNLAKFNEIGDAAISGFILGEPVTPPPVTPPPVTPPPSTPTTPTWQNAPFTAQSGQFIVQFNARPTATNEDTVIGLSNGAASTHTQLAAIVRFNNTGLIDARNGGTYAQQSPIRYAPGATYHFKLVVNVPQHTYSIYVTPPGGSQITLGQNFAFRTEQGSVTRLNNLAKFNETGDAPISGFVLEPVTPPPVTPPPVTPPPVTPPPVTPPPVTPPPVTPPTTITLPSPGNATVPTWQNVPFTAQSSQFTVQFDATPTRSNEDTVIGLANGRATAHTQLAAIVRFNDTGQIDARNGGTYAQQSSIRYVPGATYHFKLIVNVSQHTYSIYVTPPGGSQVTLGQNFAFRTEQRGVASLNDLAKFNEVGEANVARVTLTTQPSGPVSQPMDRIALPPAGKLYDGVFPGGTNTQEDDITPAEVDAYEKATGAKTAWVYFSNNWYRSRAFPTQTADWIRSRGSVPYVRLMTRSDYHHATGPDPVFTLQRIINGDFDSDFRAWAQGAKNYGGPVMVEWGTEANGDWFNWNGRWAGGSQTNGFGDPNKADGPERFVAAYRHIVQVMRDAGASNLTWVWHVNWADGPAESWNRLENYYPGNDVVDLVGISAYGPLRPTQNWDGGSFRQEMDSAYQRVQSVASGKPVIVSEFGAAVNNPIISAQDFASSALTDLLTHRWPHVVGFTWWNEHWVNDSNPANDTDMRVQDSAALTSVFRNRFSTYASNIQQTPVIVRG